MSKDTKIYFIPGTDVDRLLDVLAKAGPVYLPRETEVFRGDPQYRYARRGENDTYTFYGYRPQEPLKQFTFAGRMKVADYPGPAEEIPGQDTGQVTVFGAAACDVASLKSLDVVYLQDEWTDVFYRDRRERLFIVSADCTAPRSTCLCTRAGIQSYPAEGFDLNLSPVSGGYLVEAGSEKGAKVLEGNRNLLKDATEALLEERKRLRAETDKKVDEINKEYKLTKSRHDLLEIQRESDDWYRHVATCIECGACLFACPTCHCFVLSDHTGEEGRFQRFKAWDACSYAGYSRMAGGSSPRLGLMERFRHRYLHKFEYYPKNFGFEACTGCGRCIEGCMGKIDMRKVFTELDRLTAGVEAP